MAVLDAIPTMERDSEVFSLDDDRAKKADT